jgi:hypothetical protein
VSLLGEQFFSGLSQDVQALPTGGPPGAVRDFFLSRSPTRGPTALGWRARDIALARGYIRGDVLPGRGRGSAAEIEATRQAAIRERPEFAEEVEEEERRKKKKETAIALPPAATTPVSAF